MSDASRTPASATDRPAEVSDPLLWKLALQVADAHEPDGADGCRNLACAGQPWPCPAWDNAQRALHLAQGGATAGATPPAAQDSPTGWPGASATPAARRATATARRESGATASAA
ncbi:hypothetical protein ABTX15_20110 [Micromonospora sp. NPDC094482]|uniref:hypothetical protein n=1 Tax=unclassified Micromonospora TaxID=2617518 RepID=UPI003333991E